MDACWAIGLNPARGHISVNSLSVSISSFVQRRADLSGNTRVEYIIAYSKWI